MLSVVSSVNAASVASMKSLTAADELRDLLIQLDNDGSPSPPLRQSSSPKISGDSPGSSDLYMLVQATEEISHRLREENEALRNDNAKLRSNLITLIEDNNRLYEEMRSTFVSDMLRLINMDDGRPHTDKELQLLDLYTKQMRSLEVELRDAKEKLNVYDTAWHSSDEPMSCLKCGAMLPFGQHLSERNERLVNIIEENEANKHKMQQMQVKLERTGAKEQEVLMKLQESLLITEQCQVASAEAIVERDQLQRELVETQRRLKRLIDEMDGKVTSGTQSIEIVCHERLKDSAEKMQKLDNKCAQYELVIDRLAREKTSLAVDLDVWKERIHRQEMDLSQAADSVKLQVQSAMCERDQANSATMRIRSEFEKLLLHSNQDSLRMRHQLSSVENRLNDVEAELLNSKKQCLDSNEEINRLTRENLMLKSTKQTLEQSREENLDAILVLLKQREEDYRQAIENLAVERQQSLSQLEDLVQHQNTLLTKLRSYSRQLTHEIEKIHERKNELVQNMTIENQELRMKLVNAYERLEQADTQLVQHGDTHVKLKQRMMQLNNKVQAYEHIISKINGEDLTAYKRTLALASE